MAARLSRYTAENQYGMVGFGAGPGPVSGMDVAAAAEGITGGAMTDNGAAPAPAATGDTLVLPGNILEDPTFWMIATLGAILGLAAYSAGPAPE